MTARKLESILAWATLCGLVVYAPLETWVSLPSGLWDPFYLVDFIAMALLGWGAWRSLRARPRSDPHILCAAYAWAACNGWRATWGRVFELQRGGELDYGSAELWVVAIASAIALVCFAIALALVVRTR